MRMYKVIAHILRVYVIIVKTSQSNLHIFTIQLSNIHYEALRSISIGQPHLYYSPTKFFSIENDSSDSFFVIKSLNFL
jgi:hypothetical protein